MSPRPRPGRSRADPGRERESQRKDGAYVIAPELVSEICARTHVPTTMENGSSQRLRAHTERVKGERRTFCNTRDVVGLIAVAGHVLDDADARGERCLQDIHLYSVT